PMLLIIPLFWWTYPSSAATPESNSYSVAPQRSNSAASAKNGAPSMPIATAQQATPPRVQETQDYNFRIPTHEISSVTSFTYVTPAGNYSFSKQKPWDMSYTSLWGNTSTFSGYGLEESGSFLQPNASTVSVGQVRFAFNSTQFSGATINGLLSCSYDFSKTPERTSCSYSQVKS